MIVNAKLPNLIRLDPNLLALTSQDGGAASAAVLSKEMGRL